MSLKIKHRRAEIVHVDRCFTRILISAVKRESEEYAAVEIPVVEQLKKISHVVRVKKASSCELRRRRFEEESFFYASLGKHHQSLISFFGIAVIKIFATRMRRLRCTHEWMFFINY